MFTPSVERQTFRKLSHSVPEGDVAVALFCLQRYMEKFVLEAVEAKKQAEGADDGDGE